MDRILIAVESKYQKLVTAQVRRLVDGNCVDPFSWGPFTLDALTREDDKLLWLLPLDQKPFEPAFHHEVMVTEEDFLAEMKIPRQFSAVLVEREVVLSGQKWVQVERVYFQKRGREAKYLLRLIVYMFDEKLERESEENGKADFYRVLAQKPRSKKWWSTAIEVVGSFEDSLYRGGPMVRPT